jgi:predicted amidohydrolase YtcJ
MEGIYAAVTRRTLDGKHLDGWVPSQKISVEEALRAYTIDAAYAAFDESRLGTIEPGKLADFVVLERNLFDIPSEELNTVPIATTIVGGRVVYRKSATPTSVGAIRKNVNANH